VAEQPTRTDFDWTQRFAARASADDGDAIAAIIGLAGRTDLISFAGGFPDPAVLDREALAAVAAGVARADDAAGLQYSATRGLPRFRAYLAERLEELEGRAVADKELLVTSGGIEAMQLAAMTFLEPGDEVVVEAPIYLGALMSYASHGARIVSVTIDDEGLDVEALASMLAAGLRPKFLYTNPDHQNPAGVTLSGERRRSLVALAARHSFLVVEDVAYREFCYGDSPEPSLWSLDPDVVVQVGTFSKIFSPGLRLGWAVGPPPVIEGLAWAKQLTDQCASAFAQRLVEDYGRGGHLARQIDDATALYAERSAAMMRCLETEMPAGVTWTRPTGGFFTWLTLPEGMGSGDVAARCADAGVAVVPGIPFFLDDRGHRHLRVCFSRSTTPEIEEGVRRMGAVLAKGAHHG
jgi:2-aminoadipate transaminase